MAISDTVAAGVTPVESSKSAVSWAAIIGGAVAASALTLILVLIGSGLGLTMVSPWSGQSSSAVTVGVAGAIWFVIVQWLSAGFGGYLTGRLRTKWAGVHTDEVFFRDTAHGFLSWALATLVVVGLLGSAVSSVVSAGTQAVTAAAGATGVAAVAGASQVDSNFSTSYFTDALLRPAAGSTPPAAQSDEAAAAQVTRILLNSATQGQLDADDRAYIDQVVASRTGLSEADAKARVDGVLKRIEDAKVQAQAAADTARKAASTAALLGALSLLVGAFIASVAGAIGGSQRDEETDLVVVR